jgi:hypothetical protein
MKALNWIGEHGFSVWVKPRSSRNRVIGIRDGALHVALTAPPVEGKANEALVRFLADLLDVRQSQVELVSGERSRNKVVRVTGLGLAELRERLAHALPDEP